MAALSFGATEVIKTIINIFKPDLKIGAVISALFALAFTTGLGIGFVGWLSEIPYELTMIPVLFQIADIVTTAFILSMGSKGLNNFLEGLGIDISGGLKNKYDEYLTERNEP